VVSLTETAGTQVIRFFSVKKVSDDHLKYVILLARTKAQPTTKQTASLRINDLFEGNLSIKEVHEWTTEVHMFVL